LTLCFALYKIRAENDIQLQFDEFDDEELRSLILLWLRKWHPQNPTRSANLKFQISKYKAPDAATPEA
jgi:hypothetical protein